MKSGIGKTWLRAMPRLPVGNGRLHPQIPWKALCINCRYMATAQCLQGLPTVVQKTFYIN